MLNKIIITLECLVSNPLKKNKVTIKDEEALYQNLINLSSISIYIYIYLYIYIYQTAAIAAAAPFIKKTE